MIMTSIQLRNMSATRTTNTLDNLIRHFFRTDNYVSYDISLTFDIEAKSFCFTSKTYIVNIKH